MSDDNTNDTTMTPKHILTVRYPRPTKCQCGKKILWIRNHYETWFDVDKNNFVTHPHNCQFIEISKKAKDLLEQLEPSFYTQKVTS